MFVSMRFKSRYGYHNFHLSVKFPFCEMTFFIFFDLIKTENYNENQQSVCIHCFGIRA